MVIEYRPAGNAGNYVVADSVGLHRALDGSVQVLDQYARARNRRFGRVEDRARDRSGGALCKCLSSAEVGKHQASNRQNDIVEPSGFKCNFPHVISPQDF